LIKGIRANNIGDIIERITNRILVGASTPFSCLFFQAGKQVCNQIERSNYHKFFKMSSTRVEDVGAENIREEPPSQDEEQDDNDSGGLFECNICFEQATEPVITVCGHLFCWPCLYRWLQSQQNSNVQCPVCKAGIQKDKIIPIYGRGRDTPSANINKAPETPTEENIPNRPRGHRPDAPANPNYNPFAGHPLFGNAQQSPFFAFGGMHSVQFSDVRTLFPFPTLWSNPFANQPVSPESLDPNNEHRARLSRILMFIAIIMIVIVVGS
jgi:predicted nucleic acid-binding Zn ribbon protein